MKIITDKWKGWKYRKAASAAAVVVLIGAGIMVYQGRTRAVECARAAIQDVEDYYTEDGVISFGEEYSIISEVNGPVKELLVKENDPVKQGDVLFEVETSDYQYQLTAAENALAGLEAQLEQEQIGQMMTASPQEYLEQIRQEMENQEAEYKAALLAWQQAKGRYEESLRYLEDTIGKCQVKAEHDGIITSLPVKNVSVVQQGQTVAILKSSDEAGAQADVLTNIAPYIQVGSPVKATLTLRGKNQVYEGTVSQVYDYASKGISALGLDEYRVHVKVEFSEDCDLSGKDGYGVNLQFQLYKESGCLVVPTSAVFTVDNQEYVFLVKGNRTVKTPVTLSYETADSAVIETGIGEGDMVVSKADEEGMADGIRIRKN
ncbi:efflux RND transporter periplasmic adaptor subunit [Lachnospiraceae bacterium HCP1S3_A8]